MRILIVTDAWRPQVNGVVHTLENLAHWLSQAGVETRFITPGAFRTVALPSYPEIRLAIPSPGRIRRMIDEAGADHVHIVTEGPLGFMARRECLRAGRVFTTSYHTKFPEYLSARLPVPERWSYAWLRWFHNTAAATFVATQSLADELTAHGFRQVRLWNRGVDHERFTPDNREDLGLERPVFLNVGRVAVEKNLPAFLDLDLPGTKLVIGDGPALADLRQRYPDAIFTGEKTGPELARIFASSDVFVFPSRTDTFGIVLLEAIASGLPVAAFPVTGPADIFGDGVGGVISEDLRQACIDALAITPREAREKAMRFGWKACAELFLHLVEDAHGDGRSHRRKRFARFRPGAIAQQQQR